MKKRHVIFAFLFFCFCIFILSSCKDGYKKYIELLQEIQVGMTPYWIPNPDDGPGAIIQEVGGAEQLVYDKKNAFPTLDIKITPVPNFSLTKVSEIKITGGAKASLSKILNKDIEASLAISFNEKTSLSFSIDDPKLHRIETGMITETLKAFDIGNPHQDEVLKNLMKPDVRLICGALNVKGFTFTLDKTSNLDASEEAKLTTSLAEQNLKFTKISDTKFSLQASTPMYIAYYAYNVNQEELKKLYEEMKQAQDARKQINELNQTEKSNPNIKTLVATLPQLSNQYSMALKDLEKLKDNEKSVARSIDKAKDEPEKAHLKTKQNQFQIKIKDAQEQLNKIDKNIQVIEKYESLAKRNRQNENVVRDFSKKKYILFGNKTIIPEKIKDIVKE